MSELLARISEQPIHADTVDAAVAGSVGEQAALQRGAQVVTADPAEAVNTNAGGHFVSS